MNISLRAVALASLAVGLAAGVAACDDDGNGAAPTSSAASSVPAFGGAKSSTSATPAGRLGKSIKGIDPCTLLKPADIPELQQPKGGIDTPKTYNTSGDPFCSGYDFSVRFDTDVINEIRDANADIKGFRAKVEKQQSGCDLKMEVAKGEAIIVAITLLSKPQLDKCEIAKRGAEIIAGRLP